MVKVIAGPVDSDKNSRVRGFLDSLLDSKYAKDGFTNGGPVVAFRHPRDDRVNPEYMGRHKVHVTDSADEIASRIGSDTGTVVISGVSHYDSNLVPLIDALARSDRQVIVAGLNLDHHGKPYGIMEEVMALADDVELAKAICFRARGRDTCQELEVSRSVKLDEREYVAACVQHFKYPDSPPVSHNDLGRLTAYVGAVCSSKSTKWNTVRQKLVEGGIVPVVFKYFNGEDRYGQNAGELMGSGKITLHTGETIDAINISAGLHIEEYIGNYGGDSEFVFIDEAQFPDELYGSISRLVARGHKVHTNMLVRTFSRGPFMNTPSLMCLADEIKFSYSVCQQDGCGRPGTESQRVVKRAGSETIEPAHVNDPIEVIAGNRFEGVEAKDRYAYWGSCLNHLVLPGEDALPYSFDRYNSN